MSEETEEKNEDNAYGQVVIQTVIGQIVIGAEGLASTIEPLVGDILEQDEPPLSPDDLSGAVLKSIASRHPQIRSLSVGASQSHNANHTVWVRHLHGGTWWVASGNYPDPTDWKQWPPNPRAEG